MKKNILRERHKDLVNMLVRCRITIEERENPTVLDIMTDMRALNGVVTVRQTRPLSEIVSTDKQKKMKLHDNSIAHIAKIIQMAILSGTDIVDHLRMVRFSANEDEFLIIDEEYEEIFNSSINKMMKNIPETEDNIENEKQD